MHQNVGAGSCSYGDGQESSPLSDQYSACERSGLDIN